MTFYIFIFSLSILFAYLADQNTGPKSIFCLALSALVLVIVGGLRDIGVGTDTITYTESYLFRAAECHNYKDFIETECDHGYLFLNLIAYLIADKYWSSHLIVQLFTIGFVYLGLWEMRKTYKFSYALFIFVFCFIFYNQSLNFMRQYCAMAIQFYGMSVFIQRKWYLFVASMVLSYTFHSSAVLFLVVPMVYYICTTGESQGKSKMLLLISVLMIFVLYSSYFALLRYLNSVDFISDEYADRYDANNKWGGKSSIRKTLLILLMYLVLVIYRYYRSLKSERNEIIFLCILLVLYIAFYALSFYSMFLYRLGLYFYLPFMFYFIKFSSRKSHPINQFIFGLILIMDWYVYVVRNFGSGSCPYYSAILGIN